MLVQLFLIGVFVGAFITILVAISWLIKDYGNYCFSLTKDSEEVKTLKHIEKIGKLVAVFLVVIFLIALIKTVIVRQESVEKIKLHEAASKELCNQK
jgi:H+/Cl- antiporter ClcA